MIDKYRLLVCYKLPVVSPYYLTKLRLLILKNQLTLVYSEIVHLIHKEINILKLFVYHKICKWQLTYIKMVLMLHNQ